MDTKRDICYVEEINKLSACYVGMLRGRKLHIANQSGHFHIQIALNVLHAI